ncbi:MAG: cyclic nucleotide-binding domain-containing protein [Anaerolineales bacterium]|nr:cyclic nucleotide-binding domain-containing protein [Anaerolineales bacterium]
MDPLTVLRSVELFDGVSEDELQAVADICHERIYKVGDLITQQGLPGDELFVIHEGFVEVLRSDDPTDPSPKTVVNLGRGQIVGEMALVDQGPRSATVRAISDNTIVQVIHRSDFDRICEENLHLGYTVMRNIAADLSFKVRHRHLSSR